MPKAVLASALLALAILTACGGAGDEVSSAQQAEKSSLEVAAAEAEQAKAEAEKAKAEAEKAKAEAEKAKAEADKAAQVATIATAPSTQAAAPPAPAAALVPVPNVVGLDHQLAQDTMQAAGLYNLTEEDATGAGRLMLLDRNWVVVEQVPASGTEVASDSTVTLRSKKKGE